MTIQRYTYKIELKHVTDAQIASRLRAELGKISPDPALKKQWAWGFIVGAFIGASIMASADYGDMWFCLGDCRDQIKEVMK